MVAAAMREAIVEGSDIQLLTDNTITPLKAMQIMIIPCGSSLSGISRRYGSLAYGHIQE
jgi:hypothetical protein